MDPLVAKYGLAVLIVTGAGIGIYVVLCVPGMVLHRYIRTGEALTTYSYDGSAAVCQHVKVEGWGKYAAVRVGMGAIRRDQIHKDENGNWVYHYRD